MPASSATKISSGATFFNKRVFPAIWFGFLVVFVVVASANLKKAEDLLFLLGPAFMAVLGYFMFRNLVFDLADEVYDCGDSLLVKDRGEEELVPLRNIMNVNSTPLMNPPRVSLRLIEPGTLGDEIVFMPKVSFTFNPFAKNKIVEDLMIRVHEAKSSQGD